MGYKYYSLDECSNRDLVLDKLNLLQEDRKIEYYVLDNEIIQIKDIGLSILDIKELLLIFNDNNIIQYLDYIPSSHIDSLDDEDFDEDEEDDYRDRNNNSDYNYDCDDCDD